MGEILVIPTGMGSRQIYFDNIESDELWKREWGKAIGPTDSRTVDALHLQWSDAQIARWMTTRSHNGLGGGAASSSCAHL